MEKFTNQIELNKEKFKRVGVITLIIVGMFLLYREVIFWNTYKTVKNNLTGMSQDITAFQNHFLERADKMYKKGEEMKAYFNQREAKFNERFQQTTKEAPVANNETEKLLEKKQAEIDQIMEMIIHYDLRDGKNETIETKYAFLHQQILRINQLALEMNELSKS